MVLHQETTHHKSLCQDVIHSSPFLSTVRVKLGHAEGSKKWVRDIGGTGFNRSFQVGLTMRPK